jgi:hypothetical protein
MTARVGGRLMIRRSVVRAQPRSTFLHMRFCHSQRLFRGPVTLLNAKMTTARDKVRSRSAGMTVGQEEERHGHRPVQGD